MNKSIIRVKHRIKTYLRENLYILDGSCNGPMNVYEIMEQCLRESWIVMSPTEKQRFYDRYLVKMKLSITDDGQVKIVIE